MKKNFTFLIAALMLLTTFALPMGMKGQTTYEQLTSIANIDETAQYVLGIDGTGFHYTGTSSWGKTALPSAQTPLYYTLTKADDGNSFTAETTISGTTYYLQIPTTNTFSMATSAGTNTDIIIGTTQVSETNYAVANKSNTNRHLRINGTSGLRSYAGTTGTMAFFYKVVASSAPSYTVTYHANVTGTADIVETYNEGDTVTIADNTFTNPGYTFSEWNTQSDGQGDPYNAGHVIDDINDNLELYAIWIENTPPTPSGDLELTFDLTSNPGGWPTSQSTTLGEYTYTLSGVDYTFALKNVKCNSGYLMIYQPGALGLPAIEGYKLTKVVASNSGGCSTSVQVGISSSASQASYITGGAAQTWSTTSSQYTYNLTSTEVNTMYYLYVTNKNAQVTGLALTYEAAAAPTVPTPTFNYADGTTFGNEGLSVEISCATNNASIYYTLNGSTPDNSSTSYNGAISLTTTTTINAIAYDGTNYSNVATATYTYVDPNGPGTENNPYTVAQARAAIDAGTGITDVYATGIISQVDSYSSQYNSITYWISDDGTTTNQLEVYSGKGLNNTNFTSINDVEIGATVVVYGTLKKYNSTYEFDKNNYLTSYTAPQHAVEAPAFSPAAGTYADAQSVTISCTTSGADIYYTLDGNDPDANSTLYSSAINVTTTTTIKAIAYLSGVNSTIATAIYHINSQTNPYTVAQALAFNEYPANGIYVSGIVSTAPTQAPNNNGELTYYISDDGTTTAELEIYKGKGLNQAAFTAQDDIQAGDIVTVYGNVQVYNNTIEFAQGNYLVTFERPAVPSITVANALSVAYDDEQCTMAITYENMTPSGANDFNVILCDANGDVATYAWITGAEVAMDGSNYVVSCTFSANTGAARTAYLKVASGEVTSNIATLTQAAYVAPSNGNYVRISALSQLTDGCKVIIAARYNNNTNEYRAMTAATSGKPEGVVFSSTTSDNKEILPSNITSEAATYYWTVNVTNDGYTFTNASNQVIGWNSSTNFATGGNNTTWTITPETSDNDAMVAGYTGYVIKNGNTDTRAFALNNNGAFGPYATSNMNTSNYNFFLDFFVYPETYTFTIEAYTHDGSDQNPTDGWYLIASPVAENITPSASNGFFKENTTYDLFRFNQSATNAEWENYTNHSFVLENGKGYLYANSVGTELTFTGTPISGTEKTIGLVYNSGATLPGVNLVGNPFPVKATMDMSCYVMNSDRNGIEASPVSANTAIDPFTGVFVVAESENQSVKFTKLSQSSNGSKNNNGYVNLVLSQQVNRGNATLDKAVLSFNDGDQLGKFYFGNQDARIYIPQNGKEFAIVSSEPFGSMPVNFRTEVNGSYTLNINVEKAELNYLHLIDNMTGADVDLLVNPSYTFNATNLDYESRFTLVFSNSNTESAEGNEDFAFISNGNLVVAGTGTLQIVDMMGRLVNTFSTSDHVNTNSLANGVYVIRLVNGENVKTQKIVVK